MKKIIIIALSLLIAMSLGCSAPQGSSADMSGYGITTNRFFKITYSEFIEKQNVDTFAIYLGYEECHSCQNAVPVLNEYLELNNKYIYYIDVKDSEMFNAETDKENLLELLSGYYESTETNAGVPLLFFFKKGELKYVIQGEINPLEAMQEEFENGFYEID